MSTATFFPSDYVMKLRCKLNLFHFKAQLSMCFARTHTITNTVHFTEPWLAQINSVAP